MRFVKPFFELFARNARTNKVEEHKVVVRTAAYEFDTSSHKCFGKCFRVVHDLLLIGLEFGRKRFLESNGFCRDDVHERTALRTGEYGLVDEFGKFFVVGHDKAASGASERLVRRGRNEIRIRDGTGVKTSCNESRDVCDVDHEICADFVCDCSELVKLDCTCIRGRACDDEFGFVFESHFADVVVIYSARFGVYAVGHELEEFAAEVDGRTMSEVSAVGKGHTEHGVTGLQNCVVNGKVCIGTAVRLNVGIFDAEEFFCAFDGEFFRAVDELAAAVITFAGITFRVLVSVETACRSHNSGRNDVLARDELEVVLLTAEFFHHRSVKFFVYCFDAFEVNHCVLLEFIKCECGTRPTEQFILFSTVLPPLFRICVTKKSSPPRGRA